MAAQLPTNSSRSSSGVEQRIRNAWVAGSIPAFGSIWRAMPVTPERAKINRRRQTENFLNSLAKLIGCSALVIIVAAVFYVAAERMMRPDQDELAFLQTYEEDLGKSSWSGNRESAPALMSKKDDKAGSPSNAVSSMEILRSGARSSVPYVSGISNLEAKRPMIEKIVRSFFEANSVTEKVAFVRDAERVRALMNDHYSRHPIQKTKWRELGWILPVDEKGYRLGYVQANFEEGEPASLIIEETDNGSFLVDWESYARYGELEWKDFLDLKPVQPTLFRVIASKSDSSGESQAIGRVELIEIKHPASEGKVYAPLDRSDPLHASLVEQLQIGKWKDVPLTLRLCFPGKGGDAKTVRIAGVEGKGWLILQNKRS